MAAVGRRGADAAAERLTAPDVLTPHGLRTLSADAGAFDPHAYTGRCLAVRSWLGWGGLRAAGHAAAAERIRSGVLAALDRLGRAAELHAVSRSGELEPVPVGRQPRASLDGGRALGVRARVGQPRARA